MEDLQQKLVIPALRAQMGDWYYYITFLRMVDVAQRVKYAEEIHTSKKLSELIQRQLESKRSDEIANYLLMQKQRFFNSIVVGIYRGSPEWYEFDIRDNHLLDADSLPDYIDEAFGLLVLTGEERLFALDGQHRVAGIRKAVKQDEEFRSEQISVLFLAHRETEEGRERTRRLFTSLNRYAKAVSTYDKIALDEDDVIAIVVRKLVEDYELFTDARISAGRGNSIPTSDRDSITTLAFLYNALDRYLRTTKPQIDQIYQGFGLILEHIEGRWSWSKFKRIRPDDKVIDHFYEKATEFWNTMISHFDLLQEYLEDNSEYNLAQKYRNSNGGHLLFRPVGFEVITVAITVLVNSGWSLDKAVSSVADVPMMLQNLPWIGIFWNEKSKTMITSRENRAIAVDLLLYLAGADLAQLDRKKSIAKLRKELAGILAREEDEIQDYLNLREK